MGRQAGRITATVCHTLVVGALALAGCDHPKTPVRDDAGREDASAAGRDVAAGDAPPRADGASSVSDAAGAAVEAGDAAPSALDGDAPRACIPTPVDADIPVDADAGATTNDAGLDARGGPTTLPNGMCVRGAQMIHGECSCFVAFPTVCSAACTNVTADHENCGACGRACAPSALCTGGVCGSAVTPVVPGHSGCAGLTLAASGGSLYWTDRSRGTVNRLSAACGAQTLASNEVNPSMLVVSGANLFWTSPSSATVATIRKLSLAGGPPAELVTETDLSGGIPGLAASDDGTTLFYSAASKVRGVPVSGGAPFDVAIEDGGDRPMALAVSGGTIATLTVLEGNLDAVTFQPGVVASCGKPDPTDPTGQRLLNVNCARLARGFPEVFTDGLLLRDGNVIWSSFGFVRSTPINPATSATDQTFTQTLMGGEVTSLAAGPGAVIFLGEDGFIERMSTTSSAPKATALQRGQLKPGSMLVLGSSLYWSTGDCAINRASF
jgi:hypothetical protein